MQPFQQGTNSSLVCDLYLLIAQFTAPSMLDCLSMIGFGSLGPIAGSAAAGIQSDIGNVAAGSPFAMLQSAGMRGTADSWGFQAASIVFASCRVTGGTGDGNQDEHRGV
ncbi:hypothetical protein E4U45_003300 [Claviceps purpurea]|nr:hypothetical protein E4U45_003300 [Claviceps purpurea]